MFEKTPVTSFPAPRDSVLKITCESPIELPENQDEKEVFVLKKLYEHDSFRDGQLEAIRSILQCNDTLVLIPTGGGKSVIYTVAAVLIQGLSVIIEPLKFIMEEQAEKLRAKQIPAFYYNSSLTDTEMDFGVNALVVGISLMLYFSPVPSAYYPASFKMSLKQGIMSGN